MSMPNFFDFPLPEFSCEWQDMLDTKQDDIIKYVTEKLGSYEIALVRSQKLFDSMENLKYILELKEVYARIAMRLKIHELAQHCMVEIITLLGQSGCSIYTDRTNTPQLHGDIPKYYTELIIMYTFIKKQLKSILGKLDDMERVNYGFGSTFRQRELY